MSTTQAFAAKAWSLTAFASIFQDDVRVIDWNVTARYNKAFVKQFVEEREMNIFLLIDLSCSNSFGRKKELIAEISATLALSAVRNNDRVGQSFYRKSGTAASSRSGKSMFCQ